MQTHELIQGSDSWHAYRREHDNASDAPAMMGVSSYKTRDELIAERATGITPEHDAATLNRFADGHRFEALARPLAEEVIGEDLYPVTGSNGRLSASFDGLTMLEADSFEHKRLNAALREALSKPGCTGADLPLMYQIQMEQQLAVADTCERVLFMASDWTPEGDLIEEHHCWYYPNLTLRAQIVAGWEQFHKDVAAYVAPAPKAAPVVADAMESLPAVSLRLDGKLAVISNLPDFTTALRAFIERIPAKPETDLDFANAESACKALKRAEDALAAGEDAALGEMVDFEAMRRQVRDLKELARTTRLATEKLVAARKEQIRGEIVASGVARYQAHIESLNASLGRNYMPRLPVDFGGAIKGKRTVDSLLCAVNDELARAKIAAGEAYTRIQTNLKALHEHAAQHLALFADITHIVTKEADDFSALVRLRVSEHEAKEAARLEREREAIRAEEQARAQREAEATLQREREAEAKRVRELEAASKAAAPVATQAPALSVVPPTPEGLRGGYQRAWTHPDDSAAAAACTQDDGARVNLTAINEHFAPIQLTSVGLAQLGFEPVATVKASKLYRACDLPAMAAALISHLHALEAVEA